MADKEARADAEDWELVWVATVEYVKPRIGSNKKQALLLLTLVLPLPPLLFLLPAPPAQATGFQKGLCKGVVRGLCGVVRGLCGGNSLIGNSFHKT